MQLSYKKKSVPNDGLCFTCRKTEVLAWNEVKNSKSFFSLLVMSPLQFGEAVIISHAGFVLAR